MWDQSHPLWPLEPEPDALQREWIRVLITFVENQQNQQHWIEAAVARLQLRTEAVSLNGTYCKNVITIYKSFNHSQKKRCSYLFLSPKFSLLTAAGSSNCWLKSLWGCGRWRLPPPDKTVSLPPPPADASGTRFWSRNLWMASAFERENCGGPLGASSTSEFNLFTWGTDAGGWK